MHRRMTIQSNPSGALVRIDGEDIGFTPASIDYTWYGTREVQLVKDGFETQTQLVTFGPPWYQQPPLDFLSDNFAGTHIRDHRGYNFNLQPRKTSSSSEVIERARSLRNEAVYGL